MANDSYGRGGGAPRDYDRDEMDYGGSYGAPRFDGGSSGRAYRAAGQYGGGGFDRADFGAQGYGQRGGGRERAGGFGGGWGDQQRGWSAEDRQGDRDEWRGRDAVGGRDAYRGDVGQQDWGHRGEHGQGRDTSRQQRDNSNRQPQGQHDDRGFMARAGDEVRSWFGDEEAERRREMDARRDERGGGHARDDHYHHWRNEQLASFDRDYHEYRQENQAKFHNEFAAWRTERQGQRDLLGRVQEHADVVGADGEHVGTVDKVRGDRIILTKSDTEAGGKHHSIPSRWLQSADGNTVTLRKTAAEAMDHWRDEERQQEGRAAMFGGRDDGHEPPLGEQGGLNRSFSGTY